MNYDTVLSEKLDNHQLLCQLDPGNMMELAMAFPDQCAEAIRIGRASDIAAPDNISLIVISGLGGSAAGGDYIRVLFEKLGSIPVLVNRDYTTPSSVGKNTLVVLSSYSGNTEETLSSYADAKAKGAKLLCLTSGGVLKQNAIADGVPVITIPSGQPPRTALGYMMLPTVALFEKWGWLQLGEGLNQSVRAILSAREDWQPANPSAKNDAKQLAVNLFGKLPIIYGDSYKGVAAGRWKAQLNENAKILAYANTYPELTHNEIMGWQLAGKQAENLAVITLKDGCETNKTLTRMSVMSQTMSSAAFQHDVMLTADTKPGSYGGSILVNLMMLTYYIDFVSLYLAALYEVDPYEIAAINQLKNALADLG